MIGSEDQSRAALDHFRVATRVAFSTSMEANPMSPLEALRLAAIALGALYRDVAVAHCRETGCPCGWRPHACADIQALRVALTAGAMPQPSASDLLSAKAAGNA